VLDAFAMRIAAEFVAATEGMLGATSPASARDNTSEGEPTLGKSGKK